jgi:hypothetical protein
MTAQPFAARAVTLQLDEQRPAISAIVTLDRDAGIARYAIRGPRARGVFLVTPALDLHTLNPYPDTVRVQHGDGPDEPAERIDPPIINGVGYRSHSHVHIDRRENLRRLLDPRHPRTPDRTAWYGAAIVRAIVAHWASLPELPEVRAAAARRLAAALLERRRESLQCLYRERVDLNARITAEEHQAATLRALADGTAPRTS